MARAARWCAPWIVGALVGCSDAPETTHLPLLVVGIDGADQAVITELWKRGELPTLRRLADQGTFGPLDTDYALSPVIWTTIATGVGPEEHGITDFVVATAGGEIPVSSAARRRPALWEMLGKVGRRVAVIGWWASWPVEEVDGMIVGDRAALGLSNSIWPPERAPDLERWRAEAAAGGIDFGTPAPFDQQDRIVVAAAESAVAASHDLTLVYLRSVDLASHPHYGRFWSRAAWRRGEQDGGPVGAAYRGVDRALGEMLAAAPLATRVLVVSDHGFYRRQPAKRAAINLNGILASFGLTQLNGRLVDRTRSEAWTDDLQGLRQRLLIQFRAGLSEAESAALKARVSAALARCTFRSEAAAFRIEEPLPEERLAAARLIAVVRNEQADDAILIDGVELEGAIMRFQEITGGHGKTTKGVLFAAGAGFARGADTAAVSIKSLAPTILYALGMPSGQDFLQLPALELFDASFRARYPARSIATWGARETGLAQPAAGDQILLDELGALGYLQ